MNLNQEVTRFLDELNHPFRKEIEQLRLYIMEASTELTETIKWNGPNYSIGDEDRITMKIQPPKSVQLIFHRGVKKQVQPATYLIEDPSKLLTWKENDRAVATFTSMKDVENNQSMLIQIVKDWIQATT
ncbi:DUF1801 domain-containing protein [Cytophagaceae bacterium YF14B1]|uniref:DUF1801 domain-containing protein n=1 Tax=Xanthocytophaga flava TaxID=3048013 RepID=A0AAE3QSB7_9BACT|nr:DUF1801 domain-containing protein [Xanthocytophaga flavus]MDJ1482321.1 DUF1801 domain-containing protein [Xanthocytophaga flavus]